MFFFFLKRLIDGIYLILVFVLRVEFIINDAALLNKVIQLFGQFHKHNKVHWAAPRAFIEEMCEFEVDIVYDGPIKIINTQMYRENI